jgi:hypothetical protein
MKGKYHETSVDPTNVLDSHDLRVLGSAHDASTAVFVRCGNVEELP